jgi:hypothetical protein
MFAMSTLAESILGVKNVSAIMLLICVLQPRMAFIAYSTNNNQNYTFKTVQNKSQC